MRMFDATEVVPINFVFFTASAIIAGVDNHNITLSDYGFQKQYCVEYHTTSSIYSLSIHLDLFFRNSILPGVLWIGFVEHIHVSFRVSEQ